MAISKRTNERETFFLYFLPVFFQDTSFRSIGPSVYFDLTFHRNHANLPNREVVLVATFGFWNAPLESRCWYQNGALSIFAMAKEETNKICQTKWLVMRVFFLRDHAVA